MFIRLRVDHHVCFDKQSIARGFSPGMMGSQKTQGRLRPSTDRIVWLKKGRKRPAIVALEIPPIPNLQVWAMEYLNIQGLSRRQHL